MKMRLVVNTNYNALIRLLDTQKGPSAWYLHKLADLFQSFSLGAWTSNTVLVNNAVAATGTITLSSMVATDTVTIAGTVFTCVASGATGNQFNVGGNDTATAVNLAAAINATATQKVLKSVSASAASGVVTLTCLVPGQIGNCIQMAISAHGSVSGSGFLTSGTEGNTSTFAHGL